MMSNLKNLEMKIAVTSRGESHLSEVCGQFGRSYWLLIYSPGQDRWFAIDNAKNRTLKNGAGIATAMELKELGVTVVLTGETGPKAFRTLKAAGISVVHDVTGIVNDAIRDWSNGCLPEAAFANDAGSPDCLLQQVAHIKSRDT